MKVQEAMSANVHIADPNQPIRAAAKMMAECDCGALPVGDNDRLVGMITDRDIAIRATAIGKGPDTPVREVMSEGICYCYEDQEVSDVAANMGDIQVRRLPVLNREKRMVGILSICDIAKSDGQACAQAVSGVSESR
jgi:CBS domain-containing protein